MLTLRRIAAVLVGAWVGAGLVRALLDWVLGLEGPGVVAAVLAGAVLGGVGAIGEARRLEPWPPDERRDAIIGWSVVLVLVAIVGAGALLAAAS